MSQDQPLNAAKLRAALGQRYPEIRVVAETGSTNTDLAAAAQAGALDRNVLIAEYQKTGRGRRNRTWTSPPGTGLHVSVLFRPHSVSAVALNWVPLMAGVALTRAVRSLTSLSAELKWPNDLLLDVAGESKKAAGILADAVTLGEEPAVVVGIGVNVGQGPRDLPSGATSLTAAGSAVARQALAVELLGELDVLEHQWRECRGDAMRSGLLAEYRDNCATLGQQVRVEIAGEAPLTGTAESVDAGGRVVIRDAAGDQQSISAGDVVHLRASDRTRN